MKQVIVWYDKDRDMIFTNGMVDSYFYSLRPLKWNRLEVLGIL